MYQRADHSVYKIEEVVNNPSQLLLEVTESTLLLYHANCSVVVLHCTVAALSDSCSYICMRYALLGS